MVSNERLGPTETGFRNTPRYSFKSCQILHTDTGFPQFLRLLDSYEFSRRQHKEL
jgi:hypothetical protein